MKITRIIEEDFVLDYLRKRKLLEQYKKAKNYLLLGYLQQVSFKLRQPREAGIYSFRINKQFRAFCVYKEGEIRVSFIDNHQN